MNINEVLCFTDREFIVLLSFKATAWSKVSITEQICIVATNLF